MKQFSIYTDFLLQRRNNLITKKGVLKRISIVLLLLCFAYTGYAQALKATGGTGLYKDRIWWMDFKNISLDDGQTAYRDFTIGTATIHVTIDQVVFSGKISGSTPSDLSSVRLVGYNSSYANAGLDQLYNRGGTESNNTLWYALSNNLEGGSSNADPNDTPLTVTFRIRAYVTYTSTVTTPISLVFGSAETDDNTVAGYEYTQCTTNGSTWQLLEKAVQDIDEVRQINFSNNNLTAQMMMGGYGDTNGTPDPANVALLYTTKAVATSSSPLTVNAQFLCGGKSAISIGFIFDEDKGDALVSYGDAIHIFQPKLTNGDPSQASGTFTNYLSDGNRGGTPVINAGTLATPTDLYLGTNPPDNDTITNHYSAANDFDDTHQINNIDDEDAFSSTLSLNSCMKNYTVSGIAVHNNLTTAAKLIGWIDFNGNGTFEATEASAIQTIAAGQNNTVTLSWSGIPTAPSAGSTHPLRIRITTDDMTTSNPYSTVATGEVEDHTVSFSDTTNPTILACAAARTINGCSTADITSPVFSSALTASTLSVFTSAPNAGSALDNCSLSAVKYQDVANGTCPITVTRTWHFIDGSGNESTCTQSITIQDLVKPTASNPSDIVVATVNGTIPAPNIAVVTDEADNCSTPTVSWVSDATPTTSGCTETTVRTYKVTDACGNSINVTQNLIRTLSVATPTLSTVTQPTCSTATGSFTITNYNAAYTYTFTPSTGVNRSGNTVTASPGSYTVTATSGTCTSDASASVTVNAPPYSINGNVFNDPDGGNVNNSSGTTNAIPSGIYANLINNATGLVVASVPVATNGTYTICGAVTGNTYYVSLTKAQSTVGDAAPTPSLPSFWMNTGEYTGAENTGTDGTIDGKSATFTISSANQSNVNFGIKEVCTSGTIFSLGNDGKIRAFTNPTTSGAMGAVINTTSYGTTTKANAMGYNPVNGKFYYFQICEGTEAVKKFVSYDPATNTYETLSTIGTGGTSFYRGTVTNDGTGYYAWSSLSVLMYYNISANTWTTVVSNINQYVDQYGSTSIQSLLGSSYSGGDLAIDGNGNMWISVGQNSSGTDPTCYIFELKSPPTSAVTGVGSVTLIRIASQSIGTGTNGIAFNSSGELLITNNANLFRLNNDCSITTVGAITPSYMGDLSGCAFPSNPLTAMDLGDAPDTYKTLLASDGSRHLPVQFNAVNHTSALMLGSKIDIETEGIPSTNADGDDLNNVDDEDGVAVFPSLATSSSSYSLTVNVTNTTGKSATLKGWIDFNRNGTFDATESATASVANNATTATLTWNGLSGLSLGAKLYSRFRIATNATEIANPTGLANDGEVEDYFELIPVVNAVDDINQTPAGKTVSGNLLTNDTNLTSVTGASFNGNNLTVDGTTENTLTKDGVTYGKIVVKSDGTYTFTPEPGYTGPVPPISYTATNAKGETDNAKVYIEVAKVYNSLANNPPVANHDVATTKQGVEVTVKPLSNDSDPDASTTLSITEIKDGQGNKMTATTPGAPQTIYNADGTAVGTAYMTGGELKFTPNTSYTGDVPFTYGISDGNGGTASSTINVTVLPTAATLADIYANDDANVKPKDVTMNGNVLTNDISSIAGLTVTGTSVTIGGTTSNLTPGTATTITGFGTITLNANGDYTFDPDANFTGTVPVVYTMKNSNGSTDQATLYLTTLPAVIDQVWIGTNSTDWNTGTNWKSGAVPNAGDNIVFATEGNNGTGGAAKNDLEVPSGITKEIGNLINESDKALVVSAGTAVVVNGTTI